MKQDDENNAVQVVCRDYLTRLAPIAERYGLGKWLQQLITANANGQCASTEEEVEMLARIVDDERLARHEIPKVIGKSYRQCFDNNFFDKFKKLKHVGIYSKISVLVFKHCNENDYC